MAKSVEKILVADSDPHHCLAAPDQLPEYVVTIRLTWEETQEALDYSGNAYAAFLVAPQLCRQRMYPDSEKEAPGGHGFALAIYAAQKGIRHIGILADRFDPSINASLEILIDAESRVARMQLGKSQLVIGLGTKWFLPFSRKNILQPLDPSLHPLNLVAHSEEIVPIKNWAAFLKEVRKPQ